ncbi:MAG: DNA helicase [Candidatus Shapirobacteria bacterium]|nr:DNA helicase [Candidatus Shapirobacteria bacterium]
MLGTVVADGIKVSDKLTIPNELMEGNLKNYVYEGDKVRLIRNYGGQEFYVVEIVGKEFVSKGSTITLTRDGYSYEYTVEEVSR